MLRMFKKKTNYIYLKTSKLNVFVASKIEKHVYINQQKTIYILGFTIFIEFLKVLYGKLFLNPNYSLPTSYSLY